MTKLTTESLEKFVNDIKTDGMCDITDYQVALALRRLLAYEQAAKKPIGSFHISGGQVEATTDYCRDGEWPVQDGEVLVYAAPVLPKQPDNLDELMNAVEEVLRISDRDHDAWDRARAAMADIRNGVEAPAQPVIPEQNKFRDLSQPVDPQISEYEKALQNEPQNIQENIPVPLELRYGDNVLWFLNELASFDASDIDSDEFDVYGEDRNGTEGCATISITELAADAAKLLSAQPVSEPYKLPSGWKLVPIEPTSKMIVAAMGMLTAEELAEVWGDMIEAAPAQEQK
ncbi:hypothetical protein MUN35_04685 [Hafnia paralvei]|uniref:hypothetical protein n=1 Tax=Hafnia paralvei TaxID=546367 RepID=UPI001FFFD0DF|nr:hypothetical protein [Hafnia paralvei]MCK2179003.1 hypothetical protein [Hafnia paralvei]